jgi:hypothetical protein
MAERLETVATTSACLSNRRDSSGLRLLEISLSLTNDDGIDVKPTREMANKVTHVDRSWKKAPALI